MRFASCLIPCLGLLLNIAVIGQGPLGPWKGGAQFYVSTTGSNASPGTFAAPWQTLSFAVTAPPVTSALAAGTLVTINVRAGNYADVGAMGAETYPLSMPARGLSLEAYEDGVFLIGGSVTAVIAVDSHGLATAQPSIISGFDISDASRGILLSASLQGGSTGAVDAAEVRNCRIHDCNFGIWIESGPLDKEAHVIEMNEIDSCGLAGIAGIPEGFSSTLVRSNCLHDSEVNVYFNGALAPAQGCAPRIFSNFIYRGEWNVFLENCSPRVINNSIAFARPFSGVIQVFGLQYISDAPEAMTLVNNILWNPMPAPGVIATDLVIQGSAGPNVIRSNNIEDGLLPGNFNINPLFVSTAPGAIDLHLQATSPMIDLGDNAFVAPSAGTLSVGPMTVRLDIGVEFDAGYPRMIDFVKFVAPPITVDVGGDEVNVTSLSAGPVANSLGSITSGGTVATVTFTLVGRPNDRYGVFAWVNQDSDPVISNRLRAQYGNLLLGSSAALPGDIITIANGNLGPTGTATFTFTADPTIVGYEAEWYFQANTAILNSAAGDMSNRIRLEMER